jgi:hypothetical protein
MLDDMQRRGVIEESDSPWSSPVLLDRKKNLDLLFCLYYRKPNDVTKKNCLPPPRIDDTLDTLAGAKWFYTLDLKSDYWQVDIHPDDKENLHSPQVRGYGSSQSCPLASAMLRRRLRGRWRLLRGLTYDSCLVYLDDVIVIGRTFQEHLLNLRKLFERFREARLKLNPEKCHLLQKEVLYLGHIVLPVGISTYSEKLKAVQKWPTLKNKHEITRRSFMVLLETFDFRFRQYCKTVDQTHRAEAILAVD